MKGTILCAVILTIGISMSGQPTISNQPVPNTYFLQKSKVQRNIGYALLGAGTIAFVIPILVLANDGGFLAPNIGLELTSIGAGMLMVAGSIPLFIIAGANKRKGMRLTLNTEPALRFQNSSFVYSRVPSASLVITF